MLFSHNQDRNYQHNENENIVYITENLFFRRDICESQETSLRNYYIRDQKSNSQIGNLADVGSQSTQKEGRQRKNQRQQRR